MVKATGTQKTTMGLEARGDMISTSGSAIVSHLWQHVYIHSNSEDKQSHPGEAPDQKGLLGLYKVRPPWPCKMAENESTAQLIEVETYDRCHGHAKCGNVVIG